MRLVSFVVLVALFGSYASEPYIYPGTPMLRNYVNQYPTSFSGIPFPYNYPQAQPPSPTQYVFFPIVINVPQVNVQTSNRGPKEETFSGYNYPIRNEYSHQPINNYNTQQEGPLVQLMRLFFAATAVNSQQSELETRTPPQVHSQNFDQLLKQMLQGALAKDETTIHLKQSTQPSQPQNEVQPQPDKSDSVYTFYNIHGLDQSHDSEMDIKLLATERPQLVESTTEEKESLAVDNLGENTSSAVLLEHQIHIVLQSRDSVQKEKEPTLSEAIDPPTNNTPRKQNPESQSDETSSTESLEQILLATERSQGDISQVPILPDSEEKTIAQQIDNFFSNIIDVKDYSFPQDELELQSLNSNLDNALYDIDGLNRLHGSERDLKLLESENNERSESQESTKEEKDEPLPIDNSNENEYKFSVNKPLDAESEVETKKHLQSVEDSVQKHTPPAAFDPQQEERSEFQSDETSSTESVEEIQPATEWSQGENNQDLNQKPTLSDSGEKTIAQLLDLFFTDDIGEEESSPQSDFQYDYDAQDWEKHYYDPDYDIFGMPRYIRRTRQADNSPDKEVETPEQKLWMKFRRVIMERIQYHGQLSKGPLEDPTPQMKALIADMQQHYQRELDQFRCNLVEEYRTVVFKCSPEGVHDLEISLTWPKDNQSENDA